MKKCGKLLVILMTLLLCVTTITACGVNSGRTDEDGDESEKEELSADSFIGTWGNADDEQLILADDGEGSFFIWGDEYDIEWSYSKKKQVVTFELEEEKYTCKLIFDNLINHT